MAWDFVFTPGGLLPNQSQARLPALCSAHHAWVLEGVKLSKVCGKHFSLEEKGKLLNADRKKMPSRKMWKFTVDTDAGRANV